MLRIGFTNKYYTLWDISEEHNYSISPYDGKPYISSVRTFNSYRQNLSLDFDKAVGKSGILNFDPNKDFDVNLQGKRSWYTPFIYKKPTIIDNDKDTKIFFGKYNGKTLGEIFVNDKQYYKWLLESTDYPGLRVIMANMSLFIKERQISFENLENSISFSQGEDTIEFLFVKNLQNTPDGYYTRLEVDSNYFLHVYFPFATRHTYNGYDYYLPVDKKGHSKRLKNKNVEITGVFSEVEYDYVSLSRTQTLKVKDFKILKDVK